MTPAIVDRMALALADLDSRWAGRRRPKAFYLMPDDWAAFTAREWPTIRTMFGNNPPIEVTDPAFNGVPVRLSSSKIQSRLYDNTTTGRAI
jgi:hypothetical protein